ncbi:MAG: hypothetical protein R3F59_03985 [Myxococcota bacterium]
MLFTLLQGCFLLSSPEPERACDAPHLWYAPDTSGDVYFGCVPPDGWVRTPPDEERLAAPPPPAPAPTGDSGAYTPTDGWVPPPPDTAPPTATHDTGWIDTADTAWGDTGLGGPDRPDTGAAPAGDTADTGWIDSGDTGVGDTGLPPDGTAPADTGVAAGDTGVALREEPPEAGAVVLEAEAPEGEDLMLMRNDEIRVVLPDGSERVLTPADTGYFIQLDQLRARQ